MEVEVSSASTSEEQDLEPTTGSTLEQKIRLGNGGRKIKQEVLDYSTQQSTVTDKKNNSTPSTSDEETDRETEVVASKYATTANVLHNKLSRTPKRRSVKSRKLGTGKRRLQGTKGQKQRKKFFQDIREYAKKLPLTNDIDGKATIKQHTGITTKNKTTPGIAINGSIGDKPERKNGQRARDDEITLDTDEIDISTESTDESFAKDRDENTLQYSDEMETDSSDSSGEESDSTYSSGVDYEEMLKSYSDKNRFKTFTEIEREDEKRYKQSTQHDTTLTGDNEYCYKSNIERTTTVTESNALETDEITDRRRQGTVEDTVVATEHATQRDGSNLTSDVQMQDDSTADTTTTNALKLSRTDDQSKIQNDKSQKTVQSKNNQPDSMERISKTQTRKRQVSFNEKIQISEINNASETNPTDTTFLPSGGYVPFENVDTTPVQNTRRSYPDFKIIAKAQTDRTQTLKERGYTMVENKVVLETPVKVEFNVDKSVLEYNVREKVLELLDLMKKVDQSMKVRSTVTDSIEWEILNMLPEDEEFSTHFQVREFTYRKFRKVIVHLKLITKYPMNRIKYSQNVKEFIFHHNVWLKTDWFNTKIESSPGIITMINPKLINRDRYKEDLINELTKVGTNLSLDEGEGTGTKQTTEAVGNAQTTIPTFYLESSIKKWGEINTEVLRINCAKEESEKLKLLLSAASEQGLIKRGSFVPAGLHLMEGKSIVTNILKSHETFLMETTGIPLTGLSTTDMQREVSPNITVQQMIEQMEGVESVEKFRVNQFQGQWIIVTRKTNKINVIKEIEKQLGSLYRHQEGQTKFITVGNKRFNNNGTNENTVATYAEILSRQYATLNVNKQSDKLGDKSSHTTQVGDRATPTPDTFGRPKTTSPPNEETSKQVGEKTVSHMQESKLFQRIKQMEAAQAQLIKKQQEMQKSQNEKQQAVAENIAEQEHKQKKIEEMIDSKLQAFSIDQTRLVKDTYAALNKETDRLVSNKINTISVTVANQVAAQIIHVFKQYMPRTEGLASSAAEAGMNPMITQDSTNSQPTPKLPNSDRSTKKMSYEHSDMLQELHAIEQNVAPKSSPHDTTLEQDKSK